MQKNTNIGCICSLIVFVIMGMVLWWVNERERKAEQVRNERWEEWRVRLKSARSTLPAVRSDMDSAAAKEMERRIWAVSAQPEGRGGNNPDYYQDHYEDYRNDPEDELRFPPEVFDASDD